MMNKTCNQLMKHNALWATIESFVPAYPTSIRGTNLVLDQRKPGNR